MLPARRLRHIDAIKAHTPNREHCVGGGFEGRTALDCDQLRYPIKPPWISKIPDILIPINPPVVCVRCMSDTNVI